MLKNTVKTVLVILLLALIALTVSSPIPTAEAETLADVVPKYAPVTLAAQEATPINYEETAPYSPHENAFLTDQVGYLDDTLSVRVEEFRWFDTNIQVTWVQVADASQLRTATYSRFPNKSTVKATNLAKREKAVLAINGDYIVYMNTGYAAKNGKVLRERYNDHDAHNFDALLMDDKGDLTIIQQMDGEKIKAWNNEHTLIHAFTFGPALVVDGVKNEHYPVKTHVATHRTQRMGIGQMDEKSYVIVTTEGPDDKNSTGLMLTEFADVFMALGAKQAYNLDGGSSSWLVLNYKRINGMHGSQHRPIADIIYFVTASPNGGDN